MERTEKDTHRGHRVCVENKFCIFKPKRVSAPLLCFLPQSWAKLVVQPLTWQLCQNTWKDQSAVRKPRPSFGIFKLFHESIAYIRTSLCLVPEAARVPCPGQLLWLMT